MAFIFKNSNKVGVQSLQEDSDSEFNEEQAQSSASSEQKSGVKTGKSRVSSSLDSSSDSQVVRSRVYWLIYLTIGLQCRPYTLMVTPETCNHVPDG